MAEIIATIIYRNVNLANSSPVFGNSKKVTRKIYKKLRQINNTESQMIAVYFMAASFPFVCIAKNEPP